MNFQNINIKSIAWGTSITLILIALINFAIVRSVSVSNDNIFSVNKSIEMENIAHRLNFAIGVLAKTDDPNQIIRQNIKEINKMRAEYQAAISVLYNGGVIRVKDGNVINTYHLQPARGHLKVSLDKLKSEWEKYQKDMNGFITQRDFTKSNKKDISWLPQKYSNFITHNQNVKNEFYKKISRDNNRANIVGWAMLVANFVMLVLLFFVLRRTIFKPIEQIRETTAKLTLGNLDTKIPFDNNSDLGKVAKNVNKLADILRNATDFSREIGQGNLDVVYQGTEDPSIIQEGNIAYELQSMRNRLKEVAEKDRQERWVNAGLAKFSKILRDTSQDLDVISYNIISNLVTYLGASQGILYVHQEQINDKNSYLESAAVYALNKRKVLERKVKKGEGLVGQAYLDRETIYINDVPETYENIASALGETKPRSILVLPLIMGEKIQGAVEILSLKPIEAYQINFVQRVSENIASTLSIAKNNERTKQIMRESQELEKRISRRT